MAYVTADNDQGFGRRLGAVPSARGVVSRSRTATQARARFGLLAKARTQPVGRSLALRRSVQIPLKGGGTSTVFARTPVIRARPKVRTIFAPVTPQLPRARVPTPEPVVERAEPGPAEPGPGGLRDVLRRGSPPDRRLGWRFTGGRWAYQPTLFTATKPKPADDTMVRTMGPREIERQRRLRGERVPVRPAGPRLVPDRPAPRVADRSATLAPDFDFAPTPAAGAEAAPAAGGVPGWLIPAVLGAAAFLI